MKSNWVSGKFSPVDVQVLVSVEVATLLVRCLDVVVGSTFCGSLCKISGNLHRQQY